MYMMLYYCYKYQREVVKSNQGLVNYGAYRSFALSNGTTAHINLCNEHKNVNIVVPCLGRTKRIWFRFILCFK